MVSYNAIYYYRQDCHEAANCRYRFYSEVENELIPQIHATFGMNEQHLGPLGCAKFHFSAQGWLLNPKS